MARGHGPPNPLTAPLSDFLDELTLDGLRVSPAVAVGAVDRVAADGDRRR